MGHLDTHKAQSQGPAERAKADIQSMFMKWIKDKDNTNWAWGIQFIARKKKLMFSGTVSFLLLALAG